MILLIKTTEYVTILLIKTTEHVLAYAMDISVLKQEREKRRRSSVNSACSSLFARIASPRCVLYLYQTI